jgi:pyrroloquinoline quinone biosynthesis protein D
MDSQRRPIRRGNVIKQATADTLVLVNMDDGQCYGLNEVGGRLWELCDGTHSLPDIIAILSHEYEAPESAIAADIVEILEELASEKLVVMES